MMMIQQEIYQIVCTVIAAPQTQVTFKNCAPFTKCTTKIDDIIIDYAGISDLVMSIYNLIKLSSNYSETTESLWFYLKYEATDFNADISNENNFKSFRYNVKLLGHTVAQRVKALPLNYLSHFWKLLELTLINCKVELKLRWTKHCVFSVVGT